MGRGDAVRLRLVPPTGARRERSLLGELSTDALHLHLCAVLVAADSDRPGFIRDAFLASIEEDTTLASTELDIAGIWRRGIGGYHISERELARVIATLQDLLHEL